MQEYAVNLLKKMIEIPSPTGNEERISHFLVEELQKLGFTSWRDEVGNAIGEFGSGKTTVLLCGHMDTVPGELPIKISEGKLYGRGSVDAKAPLAALIIASTLLLKNNFPFKVIIVGAIEEEGTSKGVKHLIDKRVKADYAIFGEPSGVGNLTIAYKGSLHLKIECITKAGHSSAPWLHQNAIEEAYQIYSLIKAIHFKEERPGSRFFSVSSSVTKIDGGSVFSTIPSRAILHVNLRFPPTIGLETLLHKITHIVTNYMENKREVSISLQVLDKCPAYEANKNSILTRSLAYAIRKIKSTQAVLVRRTGSGDMNLFGSARNIPILTYGPGDSHLDHTLNEFVVIKDYLESIKILQVGLKKLVEMHHKIHQVNSLS